MRKATGIKASKSISIVSIGIIFALFWLFDRHRRLNPIPITRAPHETFSFESLHTVRAVITPLQSKPMLFRATITSPAALDFVSVYPGMVE